MEQREHNGGSGCGVGLEQARGDGAGVPNAKGELAAQAIPGWTANDPERFWSKVDRSGGPDACWPWLKGRMYYGYGLFFIRKGKGKVINKSAHRSAWELTHGAIPKGLFVLHSCDNPPCCNPSHLRLGTQADNIKDCIERGRNAPNAIRFAHQELKRRQEVGIPRGNGKLNTEQIIEIRRRYSHGEPMSSIARRYGIRYQSVYAVVKR